MFNKTVMIILVVAVLCGSQVGWANDPSDYIVPGRREMFQRTLSGLRTAYQIFENGINDPDCTGNRELALLHALTHTIMLVIRDDGGNIDSVFESVREFGIDIRGDSLDPFDLELDVLLNEPGKYKIPPGAPDAELIRQRLDTDTIPELQEIIAELASISDTPGDRFRIYFTPQETGLRENLEVDYGEVLILKGLLYWLKCQLQAQSAYDLFVDPNDMLAEKIYGESFRVNRDLLEPYPNFLKILPTDNHPEDGVALLAQARSDLIDSIDYYLAAQDYMLNEEDPQEDDLLYIDIRQLDRIASIDEELITFRDSLINDSPIWTTIDTTKTYRLTDSYSTERGELTLQFDAMDALGGEVSGSFNFETDNSLPSVWEIDSYSIEDSQLMIELDFEDTGLEYTGYHNISNANSLLFTPLSDSLYQCRILETSDFITTGDPNGWHADNGSWNYDLPFSFPFYGVEYTSVNVCNNGFLDFADTNTSYYQSDLFNNVRIAPLMTRMHTNAPYDIYIDESQPDQVKIRWHAYANYYGERNFSVTLFQDGRFRFDYGPSGWGYQVVGISSGSGSNYILVGDGWGSGLLMGIISKDHSRINKATFEYWGSNNGVTKGLSATLIDCETEQEQIDLNPIYGSNPLLDPNSQRYPDPVELRDLLPEFDSWNWPLPDTVGQGLINKGATADQAATLGGIVPDITQLDWTLLGLQPAGEVYLQYVAPFQLGFDGDTGQFYVDFWFEDQVVLNDIAGDTDDEDSPVQGVDIEGLCMGYDNNRLYGTIFLYDQFDFNNNEYYFDLYLNHRSSNNSSPGAIRFSISADPDFPELYVYYLIVEDWGDGYLEYQWEEIGWFDCRIGSDYIDFTVPWWSMPASLPGRFISLESVGYDYDWEESNGEENNTHLQIVGWDNTPALGSISGSVSVTGAWQDAPIFVQAYSNSLDPENSIVLSTVIEQPGPYTLEGIGLGWDGYVRAFTRGDGFNLLDWEADIVQDNLPVSIREETTTGVDLVLQPWHDLYSYAVVLEPNVAYFGSTVGATGEDVTDRGCDDDRDVWHSFVPTTDGVFKVHRDADFTATLAVFDSRGNELVFAGGCYSELYFNAQAHNSYLIRIAGNWGETGDYNVIVNYYDTPLANDFCENAVEVVEHTPYVGTMEGATGPDFSEYRYQDTYDLWHSFTPTRDGVFTISLCGSDFDTTLAVLDKCKGQLLKYNDDSDSCGLQSEVRLSRKAEDTCLIRVAGYDNEVGQYVLTVTYDGPLLPHDRWFDAIALSEDVPFTGSNEGATDDDTDAWYEIFDVWHSFTPTRSGVYSVNLENTDLYASVYWIWPYWLGDLSEKHNYYESIPELSYFQAKAGATYYIQVAGEVTGQYTLTVSYIGPLVSDLDGDGDVDLWDLAFFASHWLDYCYASDWCDLTDFDENGTVDLVDFATLASEWLR